MTPAPSAQALTADQATLAARAAEALGQRRVEEALAIARTLVAQAPQAPDALQLLGACLAAQDEHDAAIQALQQALNRAPEHVGLLANLATVLRRAGRVTDAVATWQQVVERAPQDAGHWRSLGFAALDAAQAEVAVTALRRATTLAPEDTVAWRGLGLALRETGRWPLAAAALLRALQRDATDAPTWVNLGVVTRLLGRADRALDCFERARNLQHHSPDLTHATIGALVDLGRVEEALALADTLADEQPAWPQAHRTRAQLRWEFGAVSDDRGDSDPLQGFRRAAASQPEHRDMQQAWAMMLLEARQPDEALPVLMALQHQADDPALQTLIANAHALRGDSQAARPWFERALAGCGEHAPVALLNAWSRHLLMTGDAEQAVQVGLRATAQAPLDQEAWAYLATAWRLLGDAREHWLCDYDRLVAFMPVPPPAADVDPAPFLQTLRSRLEPLHRSRREPVLQSVRGGSQTPGRLFGRPDPVIASTAATLQATIQRWVATLPTDPRHPFCSRASDSLRYTGSWSVRLWSSGRHANHMHSEGWLSSAFYVSLPPTVIAAADRGTQAGCIQFGQPPEELGLDLPPRRIVQPREGWLALFPSYLWHGTVPFEDAQPRLTIAFDMVPEQR